MLNISKAPLFFSDAKGFRLFTLEYFETMFPPKREDVSEVSANEGGDPQAVEKIQELLKYIPAAEDFQNWVKVGLAVKFECSDAEGFDAWHEWSSKANNYGGIEVCSDRWDTFVPNGGIRLGSLVAMAKENGFTFPDWWQTWPPRQHEFTESYERLQQQERIPESDNTLWLSLEANRNENALATRFIDLFHADLRYVRQWKKWIRWDGKRWIIDSDGTHTLGVARRLVKIVWEELLEVARGGASRDLLSVCRTFAKSVAKSSTLQSVISLARSDERIQIDVESLNKKVNLINCQNGTIDLLDGSFYPHERNDLITQIANCHYDPNAKCPKWLETLGLIFNGDSDLIFYVQQILGYSISADQSEHLLPIFIGSGCNGKSTIWNTVLRLLGDYGGLADESLLLGTKEQHPTVVAALYQKRLVAISEPEHDAKLKESKLKALTGDGFITARRAFEDFWTFQRTHTFLMASNHLPKISGLDDGIWRRIRVIPCLVDIRKVCEPILNLDNWLASNEGPGILRWLVEGFGLWQQFGFAEPDCVRNAGLAYRHSEDSMGQFIEECCNVGPGLWVTADNLYREYVRWGGKWSSTAFGKEIAARFEKQRPKTGEYRDKTIYQGIEITLDWDALSQNGQGWA